MSMTIPQITGTLESALYADDLDAARAFYTGIIGLPECGYVAGRHIFFRVGASVLLVFRAEQTAQPAPAGRLPVPTHGTTGPGHFCIAAPPQALGEWCTYLKAQGVTIEADFCWPNGARSIYIRDPAGNSVEFADPALWQD